MNSRWRSGPDSTREPKRWLIRSRTPCSHRTSSGEACRRRIRRALMGALTAVIVFSLLTDLFGQLFAGLSLESVIDFLYTGRGGALTIIGAVAIFGAFIVLFWWMIRAGLIDQSMGSAGVEGGGKPVQSGT